MHQTIKIIVKGRVQGVGFRPFIYSLSKKYQLTGTVQNNVDHVIIIFQGQEISLKKAVDDLKMSPPPLSRVKEMSIHQVPHSDYKKFSIAASQINSHSSLPWIAADAGICRQCLEEMKEPSNRRFQYPFINCTQCGPRYTIIKDLPYDRPQTTMSTFKMCEECRKEYENPLNRRHHAQPICCSECGPALILQNQQTDILAENQLAVSQTIDLLKSGSIIGIKGIGGYHLACDATQEGPVNQIRFRKKRPQRPLAILVKSIEAARELCHVSNREAELLTDPAMPIVVLQKKKTCVLPENLSPGLSTLGIMLPYTPLHHLLFEKNRLEYLVMTSANPSGLPIIYRESSLNCLEEMCDYLLTHNRQIYLPIDDSVVQCDGEKLMYLRRARGFVPDPIKTNSKVDGIIALGGNQKNTFALGKKDHILLSPHIGDLDNEEMIHFFKTQLDHFKAWLGIKETYIAVDKHPHYAVHRMGYKLKGQMVPVQHHHAHHVSCMEDNGLVAPCFGLILDGTGYGEDGQIWGFECLYGNADSFERLAHLHYTPLPGGEKAVKEPWRNAAGLLLYYWPEEGKELAVNLFPGKSNEIAIIEQMIKKQINTPMAGTCGRIFDAVSAILGICLISTYEGEAAIKLSDYMNEPQIGKTDESYPFHLKANKDNLLQLDLSPMIKKIIQDRQNAVPLEKIIQIFHQTIVKSCVQMVLTLAKKRPELNRSVVLSGGSFQNRFLVKEIASGLQKESFHVYSHRKVPCHDGGLALGQLIIASAAERNQRR
ncbi:carbamoyltransferase HypF [Metabacillus idriensis]|uniref:carbamoyltransferase HypF n=1 Tax=Metabacillus idriensis TaxID=324768 RepID=UPI0020401263|nr:carbamoyltransferase HypF [Metabacillus idriensis]MCM3595022.1 carbamoyltransferase HypF [Metabacillus idriensis]